MLPSHQGPRRLRLQIIRSPSEADPAELARADSQGRTPQDHTSLVSSFRHSSFGGLTLKPIRGSHSPLYPPEVALLGPRLSVPEKFAV